LELAVAFAPGTLRAAAGSRNNVEPMAPQLEPARAQAAHHALRRLIAMCRH